jgi:5-methylcytosine-specific restriction endonuclease McrA
MSKVFDRIAKVKSKRLNGKNLKDFNKEIEFRILNTFRYPSRTVTMDSTGEWGRCFYCSVLLEGKRKKKYCSEEHREKMYYRYIWDWLRKKFLYKKRYVCRSCNGYASEVDHIKEISLFTTDLDKAKACFDPKNLQALCSECHKRKTAKYLRKRFSKKPVRIKRYPKKLQTFLNR